METKITQLDNKYILKKTLGSGATAKVKLGLDINEKPYAIKILKEGVPNILENEAENLKLAQHENLIEIIEISKGILSNNKGKSKIVDYIVLEYAANGELIEYVIFPKRGFGENFGRYIFNKILNGLDACHKAGIAHRDLKSDNIMITADWTIKIADFGVSTKLEGKYGTGLLSTACGTNSYMAPEINYHRSYYGTQVDIFSMGVILFSLVTAKLPFGRALASDRYYRHFITKNMDDYWALIEPKIDAVSTEFKDLINNLLAYNPAHRPNIEEIRKSPWMNLDMPSDDEVIAEFEARKAFVIPAKIIQTEEEHAKKAQERARAYRSAESLLFPYFISEDIPRECKKYCNAANPYYIQFTGSDPESILIQLSQFFEEENKNYQEVAKSEGELPKEILPEVVPNEKNTRYTFTYKIPQEKPEVGNENIEITESELEPEILEIFVELTEADNGTYILEFYKNKGSKWEFVELYNAFKEYLEKK